MSQLATSAVLHALLLVAIVSLTRRVPPSIGPTGMPSPLRNPITTHIVFIARGTLPVSGGGGGGGNRQNGPIRRAEGIGHDAATLRIAKPVFAPPDQVAERPSMPGVLLDARPLASGTRDIIGLPDSGVTFGTSLGPGTGGGVGTGSGSGIGPGTGPGVGPGTGGGIGGGVYRPGGNVTAPRVITQVKPKYTEDALVQKIQGTVTLQLVVTKEGRPDSIEVIRSLDPGGLDAAAVDAAKQWRFEPGRLSGAPVDVLVTLMLDFRIQ